MKGGAAAAECWFRFGRRFRVVELYLVEMDEKNLSKKIVDLELTSFDYPV